MNRNVRFSFSLAVTAVMLQACTIAVPAGTLKGTVNGSVGTAPNHSGSDTANTGTSTPSTGASGKVATGSGNIVATGSGNVVAGGSGNGAANDGGSIVTGGNAGQVVGAAAAPAPVIGNNGNSQIPPVAASAAPQTQVDLKAGSIDDNAKFDDFLAYQNSYKGTPMRPYDVSERHMIVVKDLNGLPVANQKVTVAAGDNTIFTGKTYANGQLLFHPKALVGADVGSRFFVTVGDDAKTSTGFARTVTGNWDIKLATAVPKAAPKIDLQIVIDTTGSMGGEIKQLQTTIASIASRIQALSQQPTLRFGVVAFKDRVGSSYLTKKQDFTSNVDDFRKFLDTLEASGGGDIPEDHESAIAEGLDQSWDATAPIRLSVMITDAVPHLDYNPTVKYTDSITKAQGLGVKFFTVGASGLTPDGEFFMRQMAQATMAQYLFITRGGDEFKGGGEVSATVNKFTETRLDDLMVNIAKGELDSLSGQ
jgi:Mg-chelatase subunit ChlD